MKWTGLTKEISKGVYFLLELKGIDSYLYIKRLSCVSPHLTMVYTFFYIKQIVKKTPIFFRFFIVIRAGKCIIVDYERRKNNALNINFFTTV